MVMVHFISFEAIRGLYSKINILINITIGITAKGHSSKMLIYPFKVCAEKVLTVCAGSADRCAPREAGR